MTTFVFVALSFLLAALLAAFFVWQTKGLTVTRLTCQSEKVPPAFHGYTLVQISDLHAKTFGRNQSALHQAIEAAQPDCIVMTGDLIDSRTRKMKPALRLAERAVSIAPVYYVPGNHESRHGLYGKLRDPLKACGVTILDNQAAVLTRGEAKITLLGIQDPTFFDTKADYVHMLHFLRQSSVTDFNILLAHRPEKVALYQEAGMDLVFSGHAHGGQIRLPWIGALLAPHQKLFPPYTQGMYTRGVTRMVVSRGLGTTIIPLRLCNRPELVVVTLQTS